MSRRLFLELLTSAVTASVAAGQTRPALTADAIDQAVLAQVDSGFAGVVLVAHGDSVVLRRAYGIGTLRPTAESAFWIASITKSFTAGAIVALQGARRLSVRDSLYHFFPSAPPDKRNITIHQLLTHTAGFGSTYTGGGLTSRPSAVRAILGQRLAYPPGEGHRYGDDDQELLAAVVEEVSGQAWEDVVRRQLLDPMGLRHTGFWCDRRQGLPRPVAAVDGRRTECEAEQPDWGHKGANGMSATMDDLRTWATAVWNGGRGASRFADLTVPQVPVRREGPFQVYAGYGVRLYAFNDDIVEVVHSGSGDDGHTAIVRQLRAGWTILVLSNAGQHKGTTWSSYVAMTIFPRDSQAYRRVRPTPDDALHRAGARRKLATPHFVEFDRR